MSGAWVAWGLLKCDGPWFPGHIHSRHGPSLHIVTGYALRPLEVGEDTARIAVDYCRLGYQSGRFRESMTTDTEVFELVRTPYGWRILRPTQPMQVLVGTVLGRGLREEDLEAIRRAARAAAQLPGLCARLARDLPSPG